MSKFDDKVCVEETLDPQRINVGVGERISKMMAAFSGLDQLRQTAKQLEQYIALNELFAA